MKYLQANVECISIEYTKYQTVPEKSREGVEFLIQAPPKQGLELQKAVTLKELNPSPRS